MNKLVLLALALALSACATVPRYSAASDVHAFLVSIRDGDRAAFDAHVDREALKTNLRARVMAEVARTSEGGGASLQAFGAFLAGPLVDVAVDALLRPEVFRAVAEMRGYSASQPLPSSLAITRFVRPLGAGAICVVAKKDGPCLLDFKDEEGTYRLVGFEGDLSLLRPKR
ncbi:MAG TPA: DUF2939 domain-containing protein [Caulobacteraceae bacterium]|jgi:hypothetical protein|nr:DUF2939 domain-containing protein [Caulobacteraceae bacterium]